jgi:hypothetical protein
VRFEEDSANAFGGGLSRVSNAGGGAMEIDRSSALANTIPDQSPSMAGRLYRQGVQIDVNDTTVAWNQARSARGIAISSGVTG